ncbi:hypothetical protein [Xenorhabdus bovienii]|uniref:hypothetical protein n=1 Tax=Xenorhabdus bovienii TaxID=40576 RepID=UPI0023B27B3D|nr:hypothetical protein [Xenorhabdus bovienii]MDE9542847.1 hypothetical protein [Xenorhabdus bovienii]
MSGARTGIGSCSPALWGRFTFQRRLAVGYGNTQTQLWEVSVLKIKLNSNRLKIEPDGRGGSVLIIDDDTKWQLEGDGKEIMRNTTYLEREDIISILNDHYQDEEVFA